MISGRMNWILLVALLVLPGFGAPASAQTTVPFARDFTVIDIPVDRAQSHFVVAFAPREINGKLAVCGAYWIDGNNAEFQSYAFEILKRLHFRALGIEMRVNAVHLTKYRSRDHAEKKNKARCRASRMKWQNVYLEEGLELDFRQDY